MKQIQKLFNRWMLGGIALAMVSSVTAQTVAERSASVVRIKGHARYASGPKSGQPIAVGAALKAGDSIQTAADSYVDLILGEENLTPVRPAMGPSASYQPKTEQDVIRVYADSVLSFDKLSLMKTGADEVTDTQLDLRAGKIFGSVKKMSTASRYEIKIPNGVAGIRGTSFTITASGVLQVNSGSVVVSWTGADGKPMTQVVNAGYQFDLRTLMLSTIPPGGPPAPKISVVSVTKEITMNQTTYYVSPKLP